MSSWWDQARNGLVLGPNMPTERRTKLPAASSNWPELAGELIGFRPAEARQIAAALSPGSRLYRPSTER